MTLSNLRRVTGNNELQGIFQFNVLTELMRDLSSNRHNHCRVYISFFMNIILSVYYSSVFVFNYKILLSCWSRFIQSFQEF